MSDPEAQSPMKPLKLASAINRPIVLLPLAFLALVTLADNTTDGAVLAILKARGAPLEPHSWNSAAVVIVAAFSDLAGQLVLGVLADRKGRGYAILLNTSSVLFSSTFTLFALLFHEQWPLLASVVAPLLRLLGGSSHASRFLVLALLHEDTSCSWQSPFFYSTGAVNALCENIGSALITQLLIHNNAFPFLISIVSCLLANGVIAVYIHGNTTSTWSGGFGDPATEPLLGSPDLSQGAQPASEQQNSPLTQSVPSSTNRLAVLAMGEIAKNWNLRLTAMIFFIAAISKATRPLFRNYIQRRYGISSDKSHQLWGQRLIVVCSIFAVLEYLTLFIVTRKTRVSLGKAFLRAAKVSILLMGVGALVIGLARTELVLIAAFFVNTLGIATDLSLLAFATAHIPRHAAGRVFMLLASLESLGFMAGVAIFHPIYRWSISQSSSWAGGTAYYVCAALYAVVAAFIWHLKVAQNSDRLKPYTGYVTNEPEVP